MPIEKIKSLKNNFMNKRINESGFGILLFVLFCSIILTSVLRGLPGNPTPETLATPTWRDDGPFELSPERSRFALTYSIVENKSLYFSLPIAKFILPDLGYKNGHYVSLFAPGVSYITIPGYLIGRFFGAAQVGVFATSAFFALLDGIMIYLISKKFGAGKIAAVLGAITFLFATPGFAYSATLYEHHISTFIILLALYLLNWDSFWTLSAIWFLCALSIPVDYPNLFMMAPIGLFALGKYFSSREVRGRIYISVKTVRILSFITIIIPLTFFLWFNWKSYGNPMQFSGTIQGVTVIDSSGKPASANVINPQNVTQFVNQKMQKKSSLAFFQTRDMLNGLYIHFLSPDRGVLYFTPAVLFGIIGIVVLYKKRNKYLPVMLGIIGADVILYSMWGDPWGGWAFGSRYLIPAYAIFSIFISVALTKFNKKIFVVVPFLLILVYSIGVNTLGALTSNTNPPQTEVLELEKLSGKQERYSYDRNWEFLTKTGSKSFIFKALGQKELTAVQYYYLITGSIILISTVLSVFLFLNKNEEI